MPLFICFFVWLLHLEPPVYCWIEITRANILVLFQILQEKYFILSLLLSMMLAVHFIGLKTIPSIPRLFSVLSQMVLDFVKCFFSCLSDNHMVLFLFLLICFITLILCMLDQPWVPRINLGYGIKSFLDLVC